MLFNKLKHNPAGGTTTLKSALLVSAAAAVIGLATTTAAQAGTMVTDWNFELNSAWTMTTPASPTVTGANTNTHFGAPSMISWGTPASMNGQSSLNVGESNGHFAGSLMTDGGFVPTVTVTHNNWPLVSTSAGGAPFLTMAILSDLLTLTPTAPPPHDNMPPGSETFSAPQIDFSIKFVETSNGVNADATGDPGGCASGGAATGNGCPDIFVLELPMGVTFEATMDGGIIKQKFPFDMFLYEAQLRIFGLDLLTDEECMAALAATGCIGLTTQENQATDFEAELQIMSMGEIVSEPGVLAVFGLGLAGLGFMRRRRKA